MAAPRWASPGRRADPATRPHRTARRPGPGNAGTAPEVLPRPTGGACTGGPSVGESPANGRSRGPARPHASADRRGFLLGVKEVLYAMAFDERYRAGVANEGGVGLRMSNWAE